MRKNDGGPAFPGEAAGVWSGPVPRLAGLSQRDWFASMALQGLTARIPPGDLGNINIQDMGDTAYQLADAMLREREKWLNTGTGEKE